MTKGVEERSLTGLDDALELGQNPTKETHGPQTPGQVKAERRAAEERGAPRPTVPRQRDCQLQRPPAVRAVFAASGTGLVGTGAAGDPLWSAAVALVAEGVGRWRPLEDAVVRRSAGGPYLPGLLALREGEVLAQAVTSLGVRPDVVIVNGTGRDHPRRAGIALHLGVVLDVPSVGVTDRPLLAAPVEPADERGAAAPLVRRDSRPRG